jgi:hypothetical protein
MSQDGNVGTCTKGAQGAPAMSDVAYQFALKRTLGGRSTKLLWLCVMVSSAMLNRAGKPFAKQFAKQASKLAQFGKLGSLATLVSNGTRRELMGSGARALFRGTCL